MSSPSEDIQDVVDDKPNGVSKLMIGPVNDVATLGNALKLEQAEDKPSLTEVEAPAAEESESKVKRDKEENTQNETQHQINSERLTEKDKNASKDSDTDINVDSDSQDTDNVKITSTGDSDENNYDAFFDPEVDYPDSGSEKEVNALSRGMGLSSSKDDSYSGKKYQDIKKEKERKAKPFSFSKRWSEKDTEAYRLGYPGKKDDMSQRMNLEFYTNKIRSRPDGDFIDKIHKEWFGDYHRLEAHHGYIQWLFPIRENGMNFHAQELQIHEAKAIRENQKAKRRVLKSYELMLDFYGIRLKDKDTGELERAENWKERYAHLNRSMHNYLRITRILKALGELGYEHFKAPFVRFILVEALKKKTLDKTVSSCYNYWLETIKDDDERAKLMDFADSLFPSPESD